MRVLGNSNIDFMMLYMFYNVWRTDNGIVPLCELTSTPPKKNRTQK